MSLPYKWGRLFFLCVYDLAKEKALLKCSSIRHLIFIYNYDFTNKPTRKYQRKIMSWQQRSLRSKANPKTPMSQSFIYTKNKEYFP